MTKKKLPTAPAGRVHVGVSSHLQPRALDRWNPSVQAAAPADRSISVYDVIGQDYWTGEGVTSKRIAGALRNMGPGPVTVNINSPGGDMFEGLAIYNMLREHDGEVTVKIIGLAASAASIIAMAGDIVQIARAGFLMIHNSWVGAMGNRHDLREYADTLEPFDRAMADIYAARTGESREKMSDMMDSETWLPGSDAIEQGFADELLESDQVDASAPRSSASAVRRVENALRASGLPKSEAMKLISELKSAAGDPRGSAGPAGEHVKGEPDVTSEVHAALLQHPILTN